MSDARVMRGRQESVASAVRRLPFAVGNGSEAMLAQIKTVDAFPTVAPAFYACSPLRIDGPELEGAAATLLEDPSLTIMAFNLGSRIPPVGTKLIVHSCGGRWTFRYDG